MSFPKTSPIFCFKVILISILFSFNISAQVDWYERESEHFKVIFRGSHQHLVSHIINSAESAYEVLARIFKYEPDSKIIINTYDINDYGFGATTSIPENFIRLEIEPLEPGYENTPYNERFQWILSHELVHVFVNDGATGVEKVSRSLFGKVAPVQMQPLTILYSLSGNYRRYTPRWHQEASAVFLETWLSGGFGRVLGSFDEMYFRTLVADSIKFPGPAELESITSHNSFLLETLFYLYGGRFAAYLSIKYGSDKLIEWFKPLKGEWYPSFESKFRKVYNKDFSDEWNSFIRYESEFQTNNLKKLESAGFTKLNYLAHKAQGWVTQPYLVGDSLVLFGNHRAHNLAGIQLLNTGKKTFKELTTLPSPSIFQVASTAYDSSTGLFFYTTNNNHLYRDLWVLDVSTGETKLIFPDARIGNLTVGTATRELWGIQHWSGRASLVYSVYPYKEFFNIYNFPMSEEILNIAVSPNGELMALVIHESSGEQKLVMIELSKLKTSRNFFPVTISDKGDPENPSWSSDQNELLWNAYTNGVSNIYSFKFDTKEVTPLTNTNKGLFKPVFINNDSIFAFEYSNDGFVPVSFTRESPAYVPAIEYLGQRIINQEPYLTQWMVNKNEPAALSEMKDETDYSSLSNLKLLTAVPVVTGFQNQAALGVFMNIADPLINHDLYTEIAYSPFEKSNPNPRFHLKVRYDYMKKYELGIEYNAPDFYDLFNERKRGMIGTKVRLGNIHYWLYDNPLKIVQKTEIAVYTGVKYINDNIVSVSEPDFSVAQTSWNYKNLRRTIGSSDFEHGEEYNVTLMAFGTDPHNPTFTSSIFGEWDFYRLWISDHNVFHYKIAAGYHHPNERLTQSRFYFGGFGNRLVDNVDVKQFRNIFRFPGVPIYSVNTDKFFKLLLENNFPPLRFSNLSFAQQLINHIDCSVYSQTLFLESEIDNFYIDLGAQINLVLKNWFNLETTLSAGAARAWYGDANSFEWFFSVKLLKN